ncbi:MAG: HAMP domain-containing histidine kinase [Patescibacteria group bacterium]|nr:HAMP domain-containing histidine kinase [Patescibacteria group bacterium]
MQPQTLAEIGRTSDHLQASVAVMTAEAIRPTMHTRLVLKNHDEHAADNVLLHGLHYMDVVAQALYDRTRSSSGDALGVKTREEIEQLLNAVGPQLAVLIDLQLGVGILTSLIKHNLGERELHTSQEAKELFGARPADSPEKAIEAFNELYGEKTSFGRFVADYNFGESGISASVFIATYFENSFARIRNSISYSDAPKKEVMFDFMGTESLIESLTDNKSSVDRIRSASVADPLGLEEQNKRERMIEAYSLVAHEWRTPLTTLLGIMQIAERLLVPRDDREPDVQRAMLLMNRFTSQVTVLDTVREHMFKALQQGFVPAEISPSHLIEQSSQQLAVLLGDRVNSMGADFPTGATVSISPLVWNGIMNNAVQNAIRARQAWLIREKKMNANRAEKKARKDVRMICTVILNKRDDTIRVLLTDNGRGITKGRRTNRFVPGDHGYDVAGVESHGIAMYQYAEAMRKAGGDLYLLQTQSGIGATLIVKLPLHISPEATAEQ